MPRFDLHANGNTYTIEGDGAVCAVAATLTESVIVGAGLAPATVADCNAVIRSRRSEIRSRRSELITALQTISGYDAFSRAASKLAGMLALTDARSPRHDRRARPEVMNA